MNFGKQVEEALKDRGLTDIKFSNEAEISPTTLRKIKRSDRSLNINKLDKAADALDMTVVIKLVPKPEAETVGAS
jgi:transcriptional regulator with XRE-family HTH domain